MKTLRLMFYSFLIMNMCLLIGCDKDEVSQEIPITDISTLFFDYRNVTDVAVINSENELAKYLKSAEDLPEIDFSKHTLLLAHGGTTQGVSSISKKIIKQSSEKYIFDVAVQLTMAMVAEGWLLAVLTTEKLSSKKVKLDVTQYK